MLSCKAVETPFEPNIKLQLDKKKCMVNKEDYQRLAGRLICLSHTLPDIALAVSLVSQFMHSLGKEQFDDAHQILRYLKGLLERDCYLKGVDIYKLRLIEMLNGLEVQLLGGQLWATAPLLAEIQFLGIARNKV